MDTLGVYISVPFCRSKCTYCNFASGVYPQSYHRGYVERVVEDLGSSREWARKLGAELPEIVDTVYLGGGTPSILSPELIQDLFAAIRGEFSVLPSAEITLEAAPGQIDEPVFDVIAALGVNRLSFGVQSFVDREAAVSGRLHTRRSALDDVERARKRGISSINIDLIAGLAHQTGESWKDSLSTFLETGAPHASVYMLEVDEDSRLGREVLDHGSRYHAAAVPSDDAIAEMYAVAVELLGRSGIRQYEISNFARDGHESLHNRRYWERKPYLGVGIDASSMLRRADGHVLRTTTTDDLKQYLARQNEVEQQLLGSAQQLEEAWFLGLRMNRGISQESLEAEFGTRLVAPTVAIAEELVSEGLLERTENCWALSPSGRMLSNEVFERFIGFAEDQSAAEMSISLAEETGKERNGN